MSDCKTCGEPAFPNETYCSKSCEVESDFALGRNGQEIRAALPDAPSDYLDDADVTDGWSDPPPVEPKCTCDWTDEGHRLGPPDGEPRCERHPLHGRWWGDPVLPTDSEERKEIPVFSGVLNYFPLAIAAIARVSKRGNDKHNPGQPLHWARGKSMDHLDCIARHLIDVATVNAAGEYEDAAALAWRALAELQELEEMRLGKPMSRGSKESI